MTTKELNAIRHAAFLAWAETESGKTLLKNNAGVNSKKIFEVWRINCRTVAQIWEVTKTSQINANTIADAGFTGSVNIDHLFTINKQTKLITFATGISTIEIPETT